MSKVENYRYMYDDEEEDEEDEEVEDEDEEEEDEDEAENDEQFTDDKLFPPVNLLYLREHIENLNRPFSLSEDLNGFDLEFERIEYESSKYWKLEDYTSSSLEYNRYKNRYANVLPSERTRVVLNYTGESGSDYINANYIHNHYDEKVYIAAQGPLRNTCYDFWRMVYNENANVIVMLTKLKENSKHKCFKYWPDLGDPHVYGEYVITLISTQPSNEDYDIIIVRTLLLENTSLNTKREVTHIQYIEWPDHGLPNSTAKFRETLHLVDAIHKKHDFNDDGTPKDKINPIILHCSAGIGRTGTFCAVHSTLDNINRGASTLNLPEVVLRLRRDRNGMVQTRDQYGFCYLAILEELEARNYFDIPLS